MWWICKQMNGILVHLSLMIGWRTISGNNERVSSLFTFVCVCVCVCVYARTWATPLPLLITGFLSYEKYFWFEWSLENEKRSIFSLENSSFTLLIGIFPYVALVKFCFPAAGHSFSSRDVKFELRRPCTNRNQNIFFSKIPFFRLRGSFFRY